MLTDLIPVIERLDHWYHEGKIPEFIGRRVCDLLEKIYWEGFPDEGENGDAAGSVSEQTKL